MADERRVSPFLDTEFDERDPMFSPDGRELFYRRSNEMMPVDVTTDPDFSAGKTELLFERDFGHWSWRNFDIALDGQSRV